MLMAVLIIGLIIADYYFNYGVRVLTYIFLGSITSILFYLLCAYGYEKINWIFLTIIPIYVIFSLLSIYFRKVNISDTPDMCDSQEMPENDCECKKVQQDSCTSEKKEIAMDNCLPNPVKIKTRC
jgi:hypothetical protein